MEEKAYVERMNEKYIVGVPPLFVNEKVVIDGDEAGNGDADARAEPDDTELDKLEGQFEKVQNDKEQREKEWKEAKSGASGVEIQSRL